MALNVGCNLEGLVNYFKQKIEYLYLEGEKAFYSAICDQIEKIKEIKDELSQKRIKIVFFFGAGASYPAGGWLSTNKLNKFALAAMGTLNNVKRFISEEELLRVGLTYENLDSPDNLIFEQIMCLMRKYFGEKPECAEVLLFQKVMPREKVIDFSRDMVPLPFIYEVTAHLIKHKLIDHVITTNFDELLDRAFMQEIGKEDYVRVHHLSKYQSVLMDKVYKRKPLLIKVHGTISYSLTMRQLVDDVFRLEKYKMKLLEKVLHGAVVVLIGHSLYNPNLQKLFYRLTTKGLLRDIFVVKRRPYSEARFIEFLLRDKPDNLILMNSETFGMEIANRIEQIKIEVSDRSKKTKKRFKATRFFTNFTKHFIRYLFFNKLKLYPCTATFYLIEFFILLMKAKGLISEEGLYDSQFIIDLIKYQPLYIKSIDEKIYEIENKQKLLLHQIDNQSINLEKEAKSLYNFIVNKNWFQKIIFSLISDRDLVRRINSVIGEELEKIKNKDPRVLEITFDTMIEKLENIKQICKSYFYTSERYNEEMCKEILCIVDRMLYKLYKSYIEQLKKCREFANVACNFLLEDILNDDKESLLKRFNVNDLCRGDVRLHCRCNINTADNLIFLQYIYCLFDKNNGTNRENIDDIIVKKLIELFWDKKLLFYNSIIHSMYSSDLYMKLNENFKETGNLDKTLIREIANLDEFTKTIFDKYFGKEYNHWPLFTKLKKNFDIEIKPYNHLLPLPRMKYNNTEDNKQPTLHYGKENFLFFVESKFQLEVINNYLFDIINNKDQIESIYIISETGRWIVESGLHQNKNNKNFKEKAKIIISEYSTCKNLKGSYHLNEINDIKDKFRELNNIIRSKCFYTNNIHIFIIKTKDGKYRGNVFYRPLKSTKISPVFIMTSDLENFMPGLSDLLKEIDNLYY